MKENLVKFCDHIVSLPGLGDRYLAWTRNRIPIILLHRANNPEFAVHGYEIAELMAFVDALEDRCVKVISLAEARRLAESRVAPRHPVVVFTADDGYADQATVLGDAFAKRNKPLTIFLITDFVDGISWTWDAKIAHAFIKTNLESIEVDVGRLKLQFDLSSPRKRTDARREFQLIGKSLDSNGIDAAVESLYRSLDLAVPNSPPAQFVPMTWEQARRLEEKGITFAPHSCSHRVLSRLPEDEVIRELTQSWHRVSAELKNPLKIIAWPIGDNEDFGERELQIAKTLGYRAAVAARHKVWSLDSSGDSFVMDRLGFSINDQGDHSFRTVTGIRRLLPLNSSDSRRVTDSNALAGVPTVVRKNYNRRTRAQSLLAYFAAKVGRFQRPAREHLEDIQRLVFVCKGNICRSPYAEALLKERGVPTSSCGLTANGIAAADEFAARIAFGRGIDLSGHKSTNIAELDIGAGDLLLGMEPKHFSELQQIAARTGARASLLGLWASPRIPWIEDPYGLAPAAFDRAFRQIEESIDGLLDDMGHLVGRVC